MNGRNLQTARCEGFPPIAAPDARVLVLGSMPSLTSLAKQQYYGHPRNAFWPIMGRLFGAGPELPYDARKRVLCRRGVAVWDVLKSCRRVGSLDTSIRTDSELSNDFVAFFRERPRIGVVFFNGQKAETAFRRHVQAKLERIDRELHYVRLPSTSPAHAARNFKEKLQAWREVKRAVESSRAVERQWSGSGVVE